jgi:TonB family protein
VLAATSLAGGVLAQPPPSGPVITNPDWVRKPTGNDLDNFYPTRSRHGGRAAIECTVTVRGTLDHCKVVGETPPGEGLGEAALALAPMFMMRPQTVDGAPVGGATVTVPVNFTGGIGGESPEQRSVPVARSLPWSASPTAADMASAYPKAALGKGSKGHLVLRCRVTEGHTTDQCDVMSEEPRGRGFGGAAKTLAREFKVSDNGDLMKQYRGLHVDIPFDFRDPQGPAVPVELYDAEWPQGPDLRAAGQIFPAAAAAAGHKTGLGVVDCEVTHLGGLTDCRVVREDPPALGFGPVVLVVAAVMRMNPWNSQGLPVDGARVQVPIRINLDPDTAPPAAPKP